MMMKQMTLATAKGFEVQDRATRKAEYLARMKRLVPLTEMCGLMEPNSPKATKGRPPVALGRVLRMYLIANGFNLAEDACEVALYKKTNQWYFGMKVQIGIESASGLIHSASVKPGNVHDSRESPGLLHGEKTRLYSDSA